MPVSIFDAAMQAKHSRPAMTISVKQRAFEVVTLPEFDAHASDTCI
jgi:hypothetical protein